MTESATPTVESARIQLTPRERKFIKHFLRYRCLEEIVQHSNAPFPHAWTAEECQRMWDTPHVRKAVEDHVEVEERINSYFQSMPSPTKKSRKAAAKK